MKTKNKVLIGCGVITLVLVIGGYGWVSAHGPWGGGPCGGFFSGGQAQGFQAQAFRKDMAEFILWKIDKKAKEMNLSPVQKAKYETFRENLKSRVTEFQAERQKMKEQFLKELGKENPDIKMLLESAKTKVNDLSGFMNKNLDLFLDFYSSLDDRQKATINDEIKERMKYHRARCQQKDASL